MREQILKKTLFVEKISREAPWEWLEKAMKDMRKSPAISLFYGLFFMGVFVLFYQFFSIIGAPYLIFVFATCALFVAPISAVGLYRVSRRHKKGKKTSFKQAIRAGWPFQAQFVLFGVLLSILILLWQLIAVLLFSLFQNGDTLPSLGAYFTYVTSTSEGFVFFVIGSFVGLLITLGIFAISAISAPLLIERDIDVITAILTSLQAVRHNIKPFLLWAGIIIFLVILSVITFMVGFIFAFPLIGHASWHACKDLVLDPEVKKTG